MSDSARPHRWQPTRLLCPWDSPGKNTGVGCLLLQKSLAESKIREYYNQEKEEENEYWGINFNSNHRYHSFYVFRVNGYKHIFPVWLFYFDSLCIPQEVGIIFDSTSAGHLSFIIIITKVIACLHCLPQGGQSILGRYYDVKVGVLQSMGSQRVRHYLATEQQQQRIKVKHSVKSIGVYCHSWSKILKTYCLLSMQFLLLLNKPLILKCVTIPPQWICKIWVLRTWSWVKDQALRPLLRN